MVRNSSAIGRGLLAAGAWCAMAATAFADDTCPMANNNRCEEPWLGVGFCAPLTDTSDCAGAEILPQSDERELTAHDVLHLPPDILRLARNEVFARHGYTFNSADLQAFFGARSWYAPAGQDVSLSAIEAANVDLIRQIEDGGAAAFGEPARAPDGQSPPPLSAWSADVHFAEGTVMQAIVHGVRARLYVADRDRVTIMRPDLGDMLSFATEPQTDDEYAVSQSWGVFPPRLLEPYVHAFGIVPQPLGRETMLGEQVTRVAIDWVDEYGNQTIVGEAWVTDDGIFVKVDVGGVFLECCGGEADIPWQLQYQLENLQRGAPDPAVFQPPTDRQWTFPG